MFGLQEQVSSMFSLSSNTSESGMFENYTMCSNWIHLGRYPTIAARSVGREMERCDVQEGCRVHVDSLEPAEQN